MKKKNNVETTQAVTAEETKKRVIQCPVTKYNPITKTVFFTVNGVPYQSNAIKYDGKSKYIDWEI